MPTGSMQRVSLETIAIVPGRKRQDLGSIRRTRLVGLCYEVGPKPEQIITPYPLTAFNGMLRAL